MIKHCWCYLQLGMLLGVLLGVLVNHLQAQFINLQITIEPELSASIENELSFGDLVINSGTSSVGLGDVRMGVFNIKAYYTQNIYIQLKYPNALTHINPAITDQIPLELQLAYNNSGSNNFDQATLVGDQLVHIPVLKGNTITYETPTEVWQSLFLYVFGTISVGNIAQGEYTGIIVLLIEYD